MLLILVIAISLSMDTFSLSLAYGMYNFNKRDMIILSIVVGLYHFFMPILGNNLGNIIFSIIDINPNIIVTIVFILIGIEMIADTLKQEENKKLSGYIGMLSFGLAVSIDSFSTGIGIRAITNELLLSYFIFFLVSLIFTYLGLNLGKKINNKIGKYSSLIGASILIIVGISYLFK